mgnify:CR=1 FL=1
MFFFLKIPAPPGTNQGRLFAGLGGDKEQLEGVPFEFDFVFVDGAIGVYDCEEILKRTTGPYYTSPSPGDVTGPVFRPPPGKKTQKQ